MRNTIMPEEEKKTGGKRQNQKYKSLLVWNLLLKRTDENHALNIEDIRTHLKTYGIDAERHSVSRDIKALMELMNKDADLAADDELDERELLNYIIEYDRQKHGYKVSQRPYEFEDLRLLAECVRASKFITRSQENNLLTAIEGLCSDYQIEELQNEVYLVGRTKTNNKSIMRSMLTINNAIRHNQKISFKYQKYTLESRSQQVDRKKGALYILSPFKLIINDGYYYLLAYNSEKKDVWTYRLDRMKDVKIIAEAREGADTFAKINMQTFTQRVFSMYGGEPVRVRIRFLNRSLDTVIDRFGNGKEVVYSPDGSYHFIFTADVELSNQFYSWVCGFYKNATILSPPEAVEGMKNFLHDISNRYES